MLAGATSIALSAKFTTPFRKQTNVFSPQQLQAIPTPQIFVGDNVKTYQANLTQSGTAAPVATVFLNSIGTVTFNRTNAGLYTAHCVGGFPALKTAVIAAPTPWNFGRGIVYQRIGDDDIAIETYNLEALPVLTLVDDVLAATFIQILVFP